MNAPASVDTVTETLIRYRPQIEAALHHAGHSHSFDHIVLGVLQGALHFYPLTDESCALMEVQSYPRFKSYHCFLAAGKLDDLIAAQDEVAQNGKRLGCDRMSIIGRRGFTRALKDHGWSETHVRMTRPIQLPT